MANSDPRLIAQRVADLERRLKKLEGSALQLAVNQKGPLPGYVRAVQINDVGQKSSMWMNLVGVTPGVAPYQAVTDASGTIRVEFGNLAANGISPAQEGLRANDSSGNPIFDSLGLIGVMKLLDSYDLNDAGYGGGGTGNQSAGTYQFPVGGGGGLTFSRTFTTTRAGISVLIFATACGFLSNTTTSWTGRNILLQLTGSGLTTVSRWGELPLLITAPSTIQGGSTTIMMIATIPNTTTMTLTLNFYTPVNGTSLTYDDYSTYVFQLGS